jgi:hypothetical protein
MRDPAETNALIAAIKACGSDQLKLDALLKGLQDEANAPLADEKDDTSVDLTSQKRTPKKATK